MQLPPSFAGLVDNGLAGTITVIVHASIIICQFGGCLFLRCGLSEVWFGFIINPLYDYAQYAFDDVDQEVSEPGVVFK